MVYLSIQTLLVLLRERGFKELAHVLEEGDLASLTSEGVDWQAADSERSCSSIRKAIC